MRQTELFIILVKLPDTGAVFRKVLKKKAVRKLPENILQLLERLFVRTPRKSLLYIILPSF